MKKLSTKEKLRKLAVIQNVSVKALKNGIRMGATITGVSFNVALDSMLEANTKTTGLVSTISAIPNNK